MRLTNSKFWLIIIIVSTIIIYFNYKGFTKKNNYTFERIIKHTEIPIHKCFDDFNTENTVISNNSISSFSLSKKNEYSIKVKYFNNEKTKNILLNLPNIYEDIVDENIFYISNFSIYKKTNEKTIKITPDKLNVIKFIIINDNILILGEYKKNNNEYVLGFFILKNNTLNLIHELHRHPTSKKEIMSLTYSGFFMKQKDKIFYTCYNYSGIYIFNSNINITYNKKIKTKDNTPLPSIVKNGKYLNYNRYNSFSTNKGVLYLSDYIFIISDRIKERGLVIDKYTINGKYLSSIGISNNTITNKDVYQMYTINNNLILLTSKGTFCLNYKNF